MDSSEGKHKKSKTKKWLLPVAALAIFVAGFWIGYDYKAEQVKKAITEAFSGLGDTNASESETADEDLNFKSYAVGETITFSTQTMKVNSAKSETFVSPTYGSPLESDEGTKFVLVNHTVTNTTDKPFTYQEFVLFDKDNRQYNASSDAIGYVDGYLNVRELAPSVPETGVVMFKVPSTTTEFKFGGRKAGTNDVYVVNFSVK